MSNEIGEVVQKVAQLLGRSLMRDGRMGSWQVYGELLEIRFSDEFDYGIVVSAKLAVTKRGEKALYGLDATVDVSCTWSSGGGEPSTAMAKALQIQRYAGVACTVKAFLDELAGRIRVAGSRTTTLKEEHVLGWFSELGASR